MAYGRYLGYSSGGGVITQITNKSTGVTLSTICGQITTHNASLSNGVEVGFTVTNTLVAATDVIIASIASATANSYALTVDAVGAGSYHLSLSNLSAAPLAEALVINVAVIKAVAS